MLGGPQPSDAVPLTDTRWAAKSEDLVWNGYKVHLSETCHTDDSDTGQPRDDPAGPPSDGVA
jgi:hypothetical protein